MMSFLVSGLVTSHAVRVSISPPRGPINNAGMSVTLIRLAQSW
jgi:hypothetical protein